MGADGSLILDTGIDTSGLAAGSKEMIKAIESFGKKAAKSIKQATKSVIATIAGVGSALAVLGKSVSSYMSTHWQTAAKLEACWQAVGEVIGPVIEQVVDLVQQAVSYLIDFLYYVGLSSKTAKQASADAKAAVQAMKRSLMGFDELNLLQRDTTTTLDNYELPDWLKKIAELLKGGYFEEAGRVLGAKLNEMVDNIDWAALGQKFSYYFKGALMFLYGVIDEFDWNNLGLKIKEFIENIDWVGIFQAISLNILAAFKGVVEGIWGLLGDTMEDPRIQKFVNSYEKLKTTTLETIDKVGKAIDTVYKKIIKPALEWIISTTLPAGLDILNEIIRITGDISDLISGQKSFEDLFGFSGEAILEIIPEDIVNTIKTRFASIKEAIESFANDPIESIKNGFKPIKDFFNETFADLDTDTLKSNITGFLQDLFDSISSLTEQISKCISTLWETYLKPFVQWLLTTAIPDMISNIPVLIQTVSDLLGVLTGDKSLSDVLTNLGNIKVPVIFQDLYTALLNLVSVFTSSTVVSDLTKLWTDVLSPMVTTTVNTIIPTLINNIADGIQKIVDTGIGSTIVTNLENLWNKFLSPILSYAVTNVVPTFFDTIAQGLTKVKNSGITETVSTTLINFWEKSLKPMLEWAEDFALPSLLDTFGESLRALTEIIKALEPILSNLWNDTLKKLLEEDLTRINNAVTEFAGTLELLGKWAKGEINFAGFVQGIRDLRAEIGTYGMGIENITYVNDLMKESSDSAKDSVTATAEAMNNAKSSMEEFTTIFDNYGHAITAVGNTKSISDSVWNIASSVRDYADALVEIGNANGIAEESTNAFIAAIDACVVSHGNNIKNLETERERIAEVSAYQDELVAIVTEYLKILQEQGVEIDGISLSTQAASEAVQAESEAIQGAANATSEAANSTIELKKATDDSKTSSENFKKANENTETSITNLGTKLDAGETDMTDYSGVVNAKAEENTTAFTEYDTNVATAMGDVQEELKDGSDDMRDFAEAVDSGATDAEGSIEVMASTIESTMSSLIGEAFEWGYDIGNQIANGLNAAQGAVRSGVRNIASIIRSYLHFSEPDEGPLSDFHTYMPDMIKEMVSGINGGKSSVSTAVSKLADEISNEVNNGDYKIKAVGVELTNGMSGFSNTIINGFENLVSSLQTIAEKVTFKIPEVATGTVVPYATSETINQMDNPTLATLVSSVADLQDMFRRFMGDYSENSNKTMDITLDGMSLARKLYPYNKQVSEEHGRSLIG